MKKFKDIKSFEDFRNYNIICTTTKQSAECLSVLENNGEKIARKGCRIEVDKRGIVVRTCYIYNAKFAGCNMIDDNLKNISYADFKKVVKRLNKEKENNCFEVDGNSRIIRIVNWAKASKLNGLFYEYSDFDIYYCDGDAKRLPCIELNKYKIKNLISIGNAFKDYEAAKEYNKYLKIQVQLKNLAYKLNEEAGKEIDWGDENQGKYSIGYRRVKAKEEIICDVCAYTKDGGSIYCVDHKFRDKAIKEIGKEDLKFYLKYNK